MAFKGNIPPVSTGGFLFIGTFIYLWVFKLETYVTTVQFYDALC